MISDEQSTDLIEEFLKEKPKSTLTELLHEKKYLGMLQEYLYPILRKRIHRKIIYKMLHLLTMTPESKIGSEGEVQSSALQHRQT